MPKRADNVRETHGWHAMLCVGYSDKDRIFIVRNSWGAAWGDKGYCYIPYDYVMHLDYNGHDSWIIKAVNDLDFSADVWEEGDSVFAHEGGLLLYDFYVSTSEPEGFVEELDALCQNYIDSEEDYYFDYEEEENGDDTIVRITNFDLTIDNPDEFLAELDTLCENYAIDENYEYYINSPASVEEEYSDEEEAEAEYTDEEETDIESEYTDEEESESEYSDEEESDIEAEYTDEESEYSDEESEYSDEEESDIEAEYTDEESEYSDEEYEE